MSKIEIDFQEGFQDDTVSVLLDGERVFMKNHVTTNYAISLAAKTELDASSPSVSVEIVIPTKTLSKKVVIEPPVYLGVSLKDDGINIETSDQPFRYM